MTDPAAPVQTVWAVYAHGGRSLDRICDSLKTAKSVCDDLIRELSRAEVVEDWVNIAAPDHPLGLWVRYTRDRPDAEVIEQRLTEHWLTTEGRWFR